MGEAGHQRENYLFHDGCFTGIRLAEQDLGEVEEFFSKQEDFFFDIFGRASIPQDATTELRPEFPLGWRFRDVFLIKIESSTRETLAIISVVSDLFALGIWNIGLFIVRTDVRGSGISQAIYHALESWLKVEGAFWIRLGVVAGQARALSFWKQLGFKHLFTRPVTKIGDCHRAVEVMIRSPYGHPLIEYSRLAVTDRLIVAEDSQVLRKRGKTGPNV